MLKELISDSQKKPGEITCGIPAFGSSAHFAAELFKMSTGISFTNIPMDGTARVFTGVLGRHINFGAPEISGGTIPYLKAHTLRGLALMAHSKAP